MQIPLFLQQNLRFRTSLKGASTGDEAENLRFRTSLKWSIHLHQRTSTGDEAENCGSAPPSNGSTGDEAEQNLRFRTSLKWSIHPQHYWHRQATKQRQASPYL